MKLKENFKKPVLAGMFAAIIFVLAFTPFGYIQLPFIKATIIHIPVIIGSILLGIRYGSILGFLFGLTSLINNTLMPTVSSFAFSPLIPLPASVNGSILALVVCFVPRILVGVLPSLIYNSLKKLFKNKFETLCLVLSGIAGSITNTLLVMHLIFLFFKDSYSQARNIAIDAVYNVILGIIAVNGIPEAVTAGVLTAAVCLPINVIRKRERTVK